MEKTIDHNEEQLRRIVREEVAAAINQILRDPDLGLKLRTDFADRLEESEAQIESEDTIPFSEVKKKLD